MLYRSILRPLLFRLPPETAHELALTALSKILRLSAPRNIAERRFLRQPFGPLHRFGITFPNPVGVAAGFDKNGIATEALGALGFGFVEVGTVTHQAQPGNPGRRLFRLPLDQALINRQGFNNDGAAALAERLSRTERRGVLGINIGKSRVVDIDDSALDYLASFELVYPHADYLVVNVSSPNTPNLRELQRADALESLLGALQKRNKELSTQRQRDPVPLLVKIAPDLTRNEIEAVADVAQRAQLAGIVATNTSISREGLRTKKALVESFGEGGLSGAPLRNRSTEVVSSLYRWTNGKMPIIGVGGIFTAEDAWDKICAGASLVQVYTGFVYQGWGIARDINEGLANIMTREGFRSLDEAVGTKSTYRA